MSTTSVPLVPVPSSTWPVSSVRSSTSGWYGPISWASDSPRARTGQAGVLERTVEASINQVPFWLTSV